MDTKTLKRRVAASTSRASEVVPPQKLVELRRSLATTQRGVLASVDTLVVEYPDVEGYEAANEALANITAAQKRVEAGIKPILDPINQARKALMELKKDLLGPLDEAEAAIRLKMKNWKLLEYQENQRAERERQAELDRKRLEAEKKIAAADKAEASGRVTQASKLIEEAADIVTQVEELEQEEAPTFRVQGSSSRVAKIWDVTDLEAVIKGVMDGKIPQDVLMVDRGRVREYFKDSKDEVASWPGFEVKDDVRIVRS